jgi:hypothetical protein
MYAVVHIFIILLFRLVRFSCFTILALNAIKAAPNEHRHHYQHANDQATLDSDERSSFFKTRSLSILFKLRKLPRAELKAMCKLYDIKYVNLMCDMPIRWNSTDKMIKAMLRME